jgi:hypothetical protein
MSDLPQHPPQAQSAFEKLRLRAEAETAGRAATRRPTWAPALAIEGELLETCIALGRLQETDKPVARLWAIFSAAEHSCLGFELHIGEKRQSEPLWFAQKSERSDGQWITGPECSPVAVDCAERALTRWRQALAQELDAVETAENYYRLDQLEQHYTPRIEEAEDRLETAAAGYALQCHLVELAAEGVAAFIGDVDAERQEGARLMGRCAR